MCLFFILGLFLHFGKLGIAWNSPEVNIEVRVKHKLSCKVV